MRAPPGRRAVSKQRGGYSVLRFRLWVPWSPAQAFEFFGDVDNLDRVTPVWFEVKILGPRPASLRVGSRVEYRIRWRGWPLRWQSLITDWSPPHSIAYRQARGPYRYFRHTHEFRPDGSGTRVLDTIEFSAVGGPLVRRLVIEPELVRIFRLRRQAVAEIAAEVEPEVAEAP